MIDLRSDTVTLPSPEMRTVMANAKVGDDVYGEDVTVNQLEAMSAEMLGKEAGLFVTSGTMGNLIAVLATCQRGDEVIMGNLSHTFCFEAGGVSALGGVMAATLPNNADGSMDLESIEAAIRGQDIHEPETRLIILENTHNRCGGVVLDHQFGNAVNTIARKHGLGMHLDGARIFNASVKSKIPVQKLAAPYDSVTFCLSKGLGAPVGSVLCGSSKFIKQARKLRKQLGGGMRQAGILAAAGIFALENNISRLEDDHRRAIDLAQGLQMVSGLRLLQGTPHTNMIYLEVAVPGGIQFEDFITTLKQNGVLVGRTGPLSMRLVTHINISNEDIKKTIAAFSQTVEKLSRHGCA